MPRAASSIEGSKEVLPRSFKVFWAGQGLSALGDAMTVVAMPLVVLAETGSIAQMGRLTGLARVAGIVATIAAGFVIDHWQPRRVMLVCDFSRCALMALIPVAALFDFRRLWLVFVVGVGGALAQSIFYVGHVSLVADLVGRARVGLANSRIEGTIALAYVFGPFAAGALSARFGPTTVLGVDSATFLVSVLALLAMGGPARTVRPAPEVVSSTSRELVGLAGLRFIRNQPELSRLTVLVAGCQLFTAAVVDLFIFRLKHDLRLSDTGTGVTFALAAVTAVLAAAATPWLRAKLSFHRLWACAVVVQGLPLVATAASNSFLLMAGTAALYMAAMTVLMICQASIRQELTPQHLLGRVTSSYLVLVALPAPLGALAATALAARFGAASVQAGVGVGLVAIAALASLIWARVPHGGGSPPT